MESNERLEYLGDAVLDLLVAEFLYREYQSLREGDLTQMKSLVVSRTWTTSFCSVPKSAVPAARSSPPYWPTHSKP